MLTVAPTKGPTAGGTSITITGTGFADGDTILIGGQLCINSTIQSNTTITCTTPAHATAAADISVTSPDDLTGTLSTAFNYQPAPTILALSPAQGPLAGTNLVTISGKDFQAGAAILFDTNPGPGTPCTLPIITTNAIVCQVPAHAAGAVEVTITNPDNQVGKLATAYTYQPAPAVTGIGAVTNGPLVGGVTLTVNGSGFLPGAIVHLLGVTGPGNGACATLTLSATVITCIVPANTSPAGGTYSVVVTNSDSQSSPIVVAAKFTYNPAPLIVSAIDDMNGDGVITPAAGDGDSNGPQTMPAGATLILTGSNFINFDTTGAAALPTVTVGGLPCASLVFVSSIKLKCLLPSNNAGSYVITVTNPDTESSNFNSYTYNDAPSISPPLSPDNGRQAAGQQITIFGSGFLPGMTVQFGTASNTPCISQTNFSCTVLAPSATAAGATPGLPIAVTVTNLDTQSFTNVAAYTYNPIPAISSISPTFGPLAGGTSIVLTGTGFTNNPSPPVVSVDGLNCQATVFTSATQVTCFAPPHPAGGPFEVRITNFDTQTFGMANAYTYRPPPSITSISPSAGPTTGSTLVTINGTGFLNGVSARVGGQNCITTSFVSSTQLQCLSPPNGTTNVPFDVVATNLDFQTATLSQAFTYMLPFNSAKRISGGYYHSCSLRDDGRVACWGNNTSGQLGDGTAINRSTPVIVQNGTDGGGDLRNVEAITTGYYHSCALISGRVKCWGLNGDGQLGDDSLSNRTLAVYVKAGPGGQPLTGVKSIDAGGYHTCAVKDDSTVVCWGLGDYGQLGNNAITTSRTPVVVKTAGPSTLTDIVQVSAGQYHTCATDSIGDIFCWGRNNFGQLGINSVTNTSLATMITGGAAATDNASYISVSAGGSHTCAARVQFLDDTTYVDCWGRNDSGQLGTTASVLTCTGSSPTTPVSCSPVAVNTMGVGGVGLVKNLVSIDAGDNHTCIQLDDGTLNCWGSNLFSQIGDGTSTDHTTPVKVKGVSGIGDLQNVTAVSSAALLSCALIVDGSVKCWGFNLNGQLGNKSNIDSTTPVVVLRDQNIGTTPSVATGIGGGYYHNCVALVDGTANCWGYNDSGELGDGTHINRTAPIKVKDPADPTGILNNVVSVSSGFNHSCALLKNKRVKCWGWNLYGQLGVGNTLNSDNPQDVLGENGNGTLSDILSVNAGDYFTCALRLGGDVFCWGQNSDGQLGDGTYSDRSTPVKVQTLLGPSDNYKGDLHNGTNVIDNLDVALFGVGLGQVITVGMPITDVALKIPAGTIVTGILSTTSIQISNPASASPAADQLNLYVRLPDVMQISTSPGYKHTCALLRSGEVYCWGLNSRGQLGQALATLNSPTALKVTAGGFSNTIAIAAGDYHTCALKSDGTVKCWGDDSDGQLGDGVALPSATQSSVPVQVRLDNTPTNLSQVTAISAGARHTCVIQSTGILPGSGIITTPNRVACWGYNAMGQLGNNTLVSSSVAVPVSDSTGFSVLDNIIQLGVGGFHSCALTATGLSTCWGYNFNGQLGNSQTTDRLIPVAVGAYQ